MLKVKELIRLTDNPVWTISPDASVSTAVQLLTEKRIGALPVVQDSSVIGIISERDIVRAVDRVGVGALDLSVNQVMTREVIVISAETTLEDCMQLMTDYHFRHLPVLEDDELVGIVSIRDLIKKVLPQRDALIEDLEKYIRGGH